MPFVNTELLPNAHNEYVCWIDIMGTQNKMRESVKTSATFIFRLHAAALENIIDGITAYPIMDGVYVTSPSQSAIKCFLYGVFTSLGREFYGSSKPEHQFLFKGSLAYGPIVHGRDVPDDVNLAIGHSSQYKNSILIGGCPRLRGISKA